MVRPAWAMASERLDHLPLSRPLAPSPLLRRQGSVWQVRQVGVPRTFGGCARATCPPRAPFRGTALQVCMCRLPTKRRPFRGEVRQVRTCRLPTERRPFGSHRQTSFQNQRNDFVCRPAPSFLPRRQNAPAEAPDPPLLHTSTSDITDNVLAQNYCHYCHCCY